MTAKCPTTGLDADVCFGGCCVPLTDAEALRAQIVEAVSWAETFDDGRIGYEKDAEMLDLYARQFAAAQLRAAAGVLGKHLAVDGWIDGDALTVVRELNIRADALDGGQP